MTKLTIAQIITVVVFIILMEITYSLKDRIHKEVIRKRRLIIGCAGAILGLLLFVLAVRHSQRYDSSWYLYVALAEIAYVAWLHNYRGCEPKTKAKAPAPVEVIVVMPELQEEHPRKAVVNH